MHTRECGRTGSDDDVEGDGRPTPISAVLRVSHFSLKCGTAVFSLSASLSPGIPCSSHPFCRLVVAPEIVSTRDYYFTRSALVSPHMAADSTRMAADSAPVGGTPWPETPLPAFKLERFFAEYEFVAPHLLCCSDCEPLAMADLLQLADAETMSMWGGLRLGYTETAGLPVRVRDLHPISPACLIVSSFLPLPALQAVHTCCLT